MFYLSLLFHLSNASLSLFLSHTGPAIRNIKEGLCCNVVTPFSFIPSCLFGILLSYIFFGIPAGLCGKKRFPLKIWGPFIQEDNVDGGGVEGSPEVATSPFGLNNISSSRKVAPEPTAIEMKPLKGDQGSENPNKNNEFDL